MCSHERVSKPSAFVVHFHHRASPIIALGLALTLISAAGSQPAPSLSFVPVVPCRVVDTRNPAGPFGAPALSAGGIRSFAIPSGPCNITSRALAYALNITVVPKSALGYLTVWPTGQTQPLVSTVNSLDGRIKANAAIVPAGSGGAISLYATDATEVIVDISGYFEDNSSSSALAFFPLPPCRVMDTRNPNGPLGGPYLMGGRERNIPILASSCGVPSSASAYSLNMTTVPHGSLSYLTVWQTGVSRPLVSTLNADTGTVTANAAITPAGTNGQISVFATNDTELVIDINGYFAPASSGSKPLWLYNVAPCRVLDTRISGSTLPLTVAVSGACTVPGTAGAFVLNATVVPQGALGYLTLWPHGVGQPLVSTLNALDGAITSNMAIVPSSNGSIDAASVGQTALVLDVSGYFAPANAPKLLTVQIPGDTANSGPGYVSSMPAGISCGWKTGVSGAVHYTTCSSTYSDGTAVTLTATPMSGSAFQSWSGGCSGSSSSCTVTMYNSLNVTANFKTLSQTLKILPADINWLEYGTLGNYKSTAYPGKSAIAVGQDFVGIDLWTGCQDFLAYASLVSFNIAALQGKTIEKATLSITAPAVPVGYHPAGFHMAVNYTSWSPSTVTWDTYASGKWLWYSQAWSASGPVWLTGPSPAYPGQTSTYDATYLVQNWSNGTLQNHGLAFESTIYYSACAFPTAELDSYTLVPVLNVTYH